MTLSAPAKVSTGISKERLELFAAHNKPVNTTQQDYPESDTGAKREKLNAIRYDYMPMKPTVEAYNRVAEFGAEKYDTDNWKKGLPMSQVSASLQRHLWDFMEGIDDDDESNLCHLDHVLWNAVALVYFRHLDIQDDRFENRLAKK